MDDYPQRLVIQEKNMQQQHNKQESSQLSVVGYNKMLIVC